MAKLLMISGDRALAEGKRGAFYNTLEELHKHFDKIDIICPKIKNSKLEIRNFFDNVTVYPSPWPLVFQSLWIWKKGRQLFKENGFDLMTVHEYPPFYNGIGARLLWQKIKVPYVLEIFHIPGHPRVASTQEAIYKFLFRFFIEFDTSKAKAVRVMNQNQVPDFLIRVGVPKEKIIYIPAIYIDLNIFKPTNIPKEYDLIFVGRLEKNKGINLLLEAVRELKVKSRKLKVLIVGSGPLKKDIKLKIKNWKLKIDMHGWAKDSAEIAELINKSRVLIMPSYNEGGPRVVLEALACGIPVLATPVGIVPDIIKSGESGEIINWNARNIFQKVKEVLDSQDKQEKYKKAGIEMVAQFEKKTAIKNYADQLKEFLT